MSRQKHTGKRSSTNCGKQRSCGKGGINRGSDASAGGEWCNVSQMAKGVWRAESRPSQTIEGTGGGEQPIAVGGGGSDD